MLRWASSWKRVRFAFVWLLSRRVDRRRPGVQPRCPRTLAKHTKQLEAKNAQDVIKGVPGIHSGYGVFRPS